MSNRIDCSIMSHAACGLYEEGDVTPTRTASAAERTAAHDLVPTRQLDTDRDIASENGASYDCVNDCMASLGIPGAVASTTVAVACLVATAGGCAIVAGGALGALLGACAASCDQLEKAP